MKLNADPRGCVMFLAIVNDGIGTKVLRETEKVGVIGGTVFLGRGTVKSHILELLGLDRAKKEIVVVMIKKKYENLIHKKINSKFELEKPNHGIALSVPLNKTIGVEYEDPAIGAEQSGGENDMKYEAIFTVVERGLGQEVVDAATSAGARGATIINARGSGIHHDTTFFAMRIEPEKEMVMIIIETEKADKISSAISETMGIEEPGKGIIFSMNINRVSGIVKRPE